MSQPSIKEPHPVKCDCDSCVDAFEGCSECEGTGKVTRYALEGHEWIADGEKDCICIINQKENA